VLLRRSASAGDDERTYTPSRRLRLLRALVELCRLVPQLLAVALTVVVVGVLTQLVTHGLGWVAVVLGGPLLVVGGGVAAALATGAKWALVGRHTVREHPLWSSFVWRNELADCFVEVLAVPWFARPALGTAAFNTWLRSLGATIGRGVWCETYWLPEPDLVELRDGATVNRGCVLQTHLFHDRVMSLDRVLLRRGSTLGPHSVVLPAAVIGRHATVGAVSLVMRGEVVPAKTLWIGNPIGPWLDEPVAG
jgi:non-ribosomal peptide synthetase-like protein